MVVLWHGPELFMQERDKKLPEGKTKSYGFFGGKVEEGEAEIDAAVREVQEETGLALEKEKLSPPDLVVDGDDTAYVYQALLPYGVKIESKDGSVVLWSRNDLETNRGEGKLMPLSAKYVERFF